MELLWTPSPEKEHQQDSSMMIAPYPAFEERRHISNAVHVNATSEDFSRGTSRPHFCFRESRANGWKA